MMLSGVSPRSAATGEISPKVPKGCLLVPDASRKASIVSDETFAVPLRNQKGCPSKLLAVCLTFEAPLDERG